MSIASGDAAVFDEVARLARVKQEHADSFRSVLQSIVHEHAPRAEGDGRGQVSPAYRADFLGRLDGIAKSARDLRQRLDRLDQHEADTPLPVVFLQARLAAAGLDADGLLRALEVLDGAHDAAKMFKTAPPDANAALELLVKRLLLAAEAHGGKLTFSSPDKRATGRLVDALNLLRPMLAPNLFPCGPDGEDFFERKVFGQTLNKARRGLNQEKLKMPP